MSKKLIIKTPSFNYSQITENIFVGSTPKSLDISKLKKQGFGLIINMRIDKKISSNILKILWLPNIDLSPFPLRHKHMILGAREAKKTLKKNEKVLVICRIGRHRSVAMAACLLIDQGFSPEEAKKLIKEKRPIADPYAKNIENTIKVFYKRHA